MPRQWLTDKFGNLVCIEYCSNKSKELWNHYTIEAYQYDYVGRKKLDFLFSIYKLQ